MNAANKFKRLDIFPQFRKFSDMWKKPLRFTVYIPLLIEKYDSWWYFMNIYPMSTCIQQWNYSILHQLIFVCEKFLRGLREQANACISHRDSVFKCVSSVFLLWWNRVLLKHNYSEDHWKTIYIIFSNLSSILFCMFFLTITISNW